MYHDSPESYFKYFKHYFNIWENNRPLKSPLLQTISIALCTYNGSRFLREQLQSLANQTLLPTEVIITDDCSSDNTLEIIQEFSKQLNIKAFKNEKSLKVTKNFERAIFLCTGDIILMCDQDDLWHSDKLAKIHAYFQENSNKLAVFCDAELVDEKGKNLGNNFWSVVRFHELQKQQWKNGQEVEILLAGNRSAGCMMAFRKELIEKIIPFPTHIPEMIHDNWITIIAAMLDKIGIIEERLISYRQHSFQQIGTRPKEASKAISLKDRFSRPRAEKLAPFLAKRDYFCTLKDALAERIDESNPNFKKLDRIINFYDIRGTLSPFHLARLFPILNLLLSGDYHLYKDQEASWKAPFVAAIGDLLE